MNTFGRARSPWFLVVVLALLVGPVNADAQNRPRPSSPDSIRVSGQLLDRATGERIPAATVSFRAVDADDAEPEVVWRGTTGSEGRFRSELIRPATYELRVEALGFPTLEEVVTLSGAGEIDLRIELAAAALELEPIVVTAARQTRLERSGFYDRRRLGMGHTRTRDEIEELSPFRFSDIFRTIPGVQVVPVGRGTGNALQYRGACRPDLVVDGVTLSGVYSVDDIVSVYDVEAVEVHSISTAPAHLTRSGCGAVLVWTRDGSRTDGRPMTWRRVLIGAGFALGVLLLAR